MVHLYEPVSCMHNFTLDLICCDFSCVRPVTHDTKAIPIVARIMDVLCVHDQIELCKSIATYCTKLGVQRQKPEHPCARHRLLSQVYVCFGPLSFQVRRSLFGRFAMANVGALFFFVSRAAAQIIFKIMNEITKKKWRRVST